MQNTTNSKTGLKKIKTKFEVKIFMSHFLILQISLHEVRRLIVASSSSKIFKKSKEKMEFRRLA